MIWACTSTPGMTGSSGVVLLSDKPIAEVPMRTILPLNAAGRHFALHDVFGGNVALRVGVVEVNPEPAMFGRSAAESDWC